MSIERSEAIGRALGSKGVPHNVLNAKHHEREAEIVKNATNGAPENMGPEGTAKMMTDGLENAKVLFAK